MPSWENRGLELNEREPKHFGREMDPRIQKVVAMIEAEQSSAAKSSDLARAVNLSVWHLSHVFRREIHVSISDYRRKRRLAKARQLLENTFLSVKEIMAVIAVNDRSHFTRDFKKVYGFTPAHYRTNKGNQRNSQGMAS